MGSFDLDNKIGIWLLPFQMAVGKCRSQVGYVKKAAYSQHAAKVPLEIMHEWYVEYHLVSQLLLSLK